MATAQPRLRSDMIPPAPTPTSTGTVPPNLRDPACLLHPGLFVSSKQVGRRDGMASDTDAGEGGGDAFEVAVVRHADDEATPGVPERLEMLDSLDRLSGDEVRVPEGDAPPRHSPDVASDEALHHDRRLVLPDHERHLPPRLGHLGGVAHAHLRSQRDHHGNEPRRNGPLPDVLQAPGRSYHPDSVNQRSRFWTPHVKKGSPSGRPGMRGIARRRVTRIASPDAGVAPRSGFQERPLITRRCHLTS